MADPIACTPRMLPHDMWLPAAHRAIAENPLNHAPVNQLSMAIPGFHATPEHLAVMVTKYWKIGGVHLTVGFLDGPSAALRARIVRHMNAWAATANVQVPSEQGLAAGPDRPDGGRRLLVVPRNRHPEHRGRPADDEPRLVHDVDPGVRVPPGRPARDRPHDGLSPRAHAPRAREPRSTEEGDRLLRSDPGLGQADGHRAGPDSHRGFRSCSRRRRPT